MLYNVAVHVTCTDSRATQKITCLYIIDFYLRPYLLSPVLIFSANPPGTYTYVIAKHISARHWIVDCGPGIGSCMYICMYVCPSRFWNAIKAPRMRDGNSICISICVRVCMHALQLTYLDHNLRPKLGDIHFLINL